MAIAETTAGAAYGVGSSGVNGLPDGRLSSCPMRYPSCSDTLWGLASQIFTFSSRGLRRLVGAG